MKVHFLAADWTCLCVVWQAGDEAISAVSGSSQLEELSSAITDDNTTKDHHHHHHHCDYEQQQQQQQSHGCDAGQLTHSLQANNRWPRWHPNVPGTPDAVSTERCSVANLQPQALRPYHWCARESSLAACVRADRLRDRCADVESFSWQRAAVSGAVYLCRWPSQSPGSAISCHQSLGCAICRTVNCRLFRLLPPDLEFFTGARRHGSNAPVLQETLENVLTATIVLSSTLVVHEVTSVTSRSLRPL